MKRKRVLGGVMVILGLLTSVTAIALTTPQVCDSTPKYYCTYVWYDSNGSGWTIRDRYYKGARDGGAQYWQLYWVADWEWNGSQWVQTWYTGQGVWHNNVNFDVWYTKTQDHTVTANAAVNGQHRYEEYTDKTGWYYWCSQRWTHYLNSGTSQNEGYGQC